MAKKKGRAILWGLVIGATAAGVYHYLQNKNKTATADEFDDFNNFEEAGDDTQAKERNYVPLNLDNAKAFVSDTIDKAKEAVSKVSRKLQKEDIEDDVIIDDIFDDTNEASSETVNSGASETDGSTDTSDEQTPDDAADDSSSTTEDFFDDDEQ